MKEFPMCGHPEWPAYPKPTPCRTVGSCPDHSYICPVCGFGRGQMPACVCTRRDDVLEGPFKMLQEAVGRGTIRYSRCHDDSVPFPFEVAYTMPEWNKLQ